PISSLQVPQGVAAIIKVIVAEPEETVGVHACGIVVDGRLLENSRPYPLAPHDQRGRIDRRLGAGEAYLWSPHPRSDDSRYWGPYRPLATAHPLATIRYP